jgi:hypothetical protein
VKLSSFGSGIGRNPKIGKEVPIPARRVMLLKPSAILKQRIRTSRFPHRHSGDSARDDATFLRNHAVGFLKGPCSAICRHAPPTARPKSVQLG